MTSYTSKDKSKCLIYSISGFILSLFVCLYYKFSHDVYSLFMTLAPIVVLIFGAIVNYFIEIKNKFYHSGIIAITVSLILKGIVNIAGTDSKYIVPLFLFGIITTIIGVINKKLIKE